MLKKILLSILTVFMFSHGASAGCATESELQSLGMRALQSELMVGALACGKKSDYNHYVSLFSPDLRWQGKQLRSYFQRYYGRASERELNTFVTQMANQASRVSLNKSSASYCKNTASLFQKVTDAMPWQVIDYAKQRYSVWHNVMPCAEKQVVAAAQ